MRHLLSFALLLSLSGCGAVALPTALDDCAEGTELTWTDVQPAFEANCTRCHSSELTSPTERQQAPAGSDYDTALAARAEADLTWFRIQNGTMPNDAALTSDADALDIHEWLSCGGPE